MEHRIVICMGSSCFARGNEKNVGVIKEFLANNRLAASVELTGARCAGECQKGPNVIIDGTVYNHMDKEALIDLLTAKLLPGASAGAGEEKR